MSSNTVSKGNILIVDDEEGIRIALSKIFQGEGYEVHSAQERDSALDLLRETEPDIVLLDIRLKNDNGVEILKDIKRIFPDLPVIMITGHGSIDNSVAAMKEGAADYILKPIDRTTILEAVRKNLELIILRSENTFLKSELRQTMGAGDITTLNRGVQEVVSIADRVKNTSASVLITGESGSGKEVLARYIHFSGNRKDANFIGINSAALSESLLLSELFGHEKGAFTGAEEQRPGKFELADGGTVFLDEIGDMSMEIQSKILRVLEERSFERVGGIRPIQVDVRVIAATNRNLEELIKTGRFRQDLYYRLKVISCHLPPLRERREDIPLLIDDFIRRYNDRYNKKITGIRSDLLDQMKKHDWPGNIRELQNLVNQAVLLCDGDEITTFQSGESFSSRQSERTSEPETNNVEVTGIAEATKRHVADFESSFIITALRRNRGNKTRAAEEMGISRKTLARKIERYGI